MAAVPSDGQKLEHLHRLLQEAKDDLEAGRYVELDGRELGEWLDGVGRADGRPPPA
jgi:hypothetical protein